MREFWDRRATEDPFYFVDNRRPYGEGEDLGFWSQGEHDLDALLAAVGASLASSDEVVEIGCGVGRLTRALAARCRDVSALDVSPKMLEHARCHGQDLDNVHWVLGDGASLTPISGASADVCISHVVFQHIPDPAVTLGYVREMGRVLRPGGWAAFQMSNDERLHVRRSRDRLATLARATLRRGPRGQSHPAWLGSAIELDELRRVAEGAGMTIERVVGAGTQMCCVRLRRNPEPAS